MPLTDEYRQHLDSAYHKRRSNDRNASLLEFQRAAQCEPSNANPIQEAGYDHLALKQIDEARSAFEQALALQPDHMGALIGLGHTFRCLQQFENAERQFRRALAVNPDHAGANLGLGYTLKSRGDRIGALAALRATVTADPLQTSAKVELANLLLELGRLKETIEVHRELIADQPGNSSQLLSFARLLLQNGDREEALSQFHAIVATDPANINAKIELGHLLHGMNRLADAEEVLKGVLSQLPEDVGALNALGWIYRTRQQPDEATTCFNRVLELHPGDVGASHGLGLLAREQQDYSKALAHFKHAAEADSDNFNIRIEIGNCHQQAKQFENAASEFERALRVQPTSRAALMGLGYAQRDAGRPDRALRAFDEASETDDHYPNAPIEAGHTLLRQGDASGAEDRFRTALTRDPSSMSGLIGLSYALRLLGRTSEAETTLRFAVEKHPANVAVAIALGHLLEAQHNFDEAAEVLGGIVERHPNHGDALAALASINRRRGDREAALLYFQRAARAEPSASRLADLAAELRELGRLDEAGRIISAALEAAPTDVKAMTERGILLRLQNLHEDACHAFRELHLVHPNHAQTLVELATEQRALGRFKDAEQTLSRALELEPDQLHALLQLGELALMRVDVDGAQRIFQQAIAAHPGNVWPRLSLARAHFETGDSAAAFALLVEARRAFHSSAEIDAIEVDMLRQQRDLKRARTVLEQATVSTDASSFWLWTHRVQLEIITGKFEDAKLVLARMRAASASELARVELLKGEIAEAQFDYDEAIACYNRAIKLTANDGWANMDLARASLLNIDTGTTRKALAMFAELSKSYLAGKGHSLNISQNHVGQLLEDFELDRLALDKLAHARGLPIEAQLARLKQIVNEHPGSTAAAIRTTIALRQAGYFSCSASTNEASSYGAVPKHIVQYWDHEPSPDIRDLMASWQSMNSGYHWQCFDDQQAIGFLDQNFPPSVLKAYRRATQPAQKADIFRLAYLTARGGIYADADDRCDAMLGDALASDKTFVAHQDNFGSIGNNFIAACPEHPVLRRALFLAVEAVNRGDQDLIWLCTGPGLLTRAFAQEWASDAESSWLRRVQVLSLGELQRFVGVHCPARYKQTNKHWSRSSFAR